LASSPDIAEFIMRVCNGRKKHQSTTTGTNWQSWLIFFLRGVSEQARDAILRVKLQQTRITGLVFGIVDPKHLCNLWP